MHEGMGWIVDADGKAHLTVTALLKNRAASMVSTVGLVMSAAALMRRSASAVTSHVRAPGAGADGRGLPGPQPVASAASTWSGC